MSNQTEANRKALKLCKLNTCKVALTYQNTCGAIAVDKRGIWGGGIDLDKDRAAQKAADACYNEGAKDCYLWVKSMCAAAPR